MAVHDYIRGSASNVAATTATTVMTCPGTFAANLESVWISNPTGGAIDVTIYAVPVGGTAGATNQLHKQVAVPAGGSFQISPHNVMKDGDFVQVYCSAIGINAWASARIVNPRN